MIRKFRRKEPNGEHRPRIPLPGMILMGIGLLTVLYFFITYVLMPILAMLTVS